MISQRGHKATKNNRFTPKADEVARGTIYDRSSYDPVSAWQRENMKINPEKCVACGNCTYVCPMGAIYIDPVLKRATINSDECVECYACFNGLSQEHLNPTLVRTVRRVFAALRIRFEPE